MVTAATRRDARERAIELLYESETKGVDIAEILEALPLRPDAYAVELATGVIDHDIELDRVLGRHAKNWPVERMAVTDRAVLRLGTFELATKLDVPTGAALSEAVELGGRYGSTDDTSRFVNGILAAVADEVRDARRWTPIEVVVFDMDGVIRHWLPAYHAEIESEFGLDDGAIARFAFADPDFRDAMLGRISADEWATRIGRAVAAEAPSDADPDAVAATVTDGWLSSRWRVDEQTVDLVRSLRDAGTRVAVFSNATTALEADMDKMGIRELFDAVANSARLGMAKPDVAAFEGAQALLDTDPARLLFVDDRPENIEGAVDAGWHAVVLRTVDRFAGVLRRLAVPGAA